MPDMLKNAPMFKRIDPKHKVRKEALPKSRGLPDVLFCPSVLTGKIGAYLLSLAELPSVLWGNGNRSFASCNHFTLLPSCAA